MFYAHFALSRKGPLAKVWLAAHWERKLTKTHVYETNIEETVDNLLNPKIKLALRTSGHLLLGVVRIHSRKARYLLQDCNEALSKIKQAFRPVAIDLPAEQRVVSKAAITMPVQEREATFAPREFAMVEIDFDLDVEEISEAELRKRFSMNQCRPEDITLQEKVIGEGRNNDAEDDDAPVDDFGGFGLDMDADLLPAPIPGDDEGREEKRQRNDADAEQTGNNHDEFPAPDFRTGEEPQSIEPVRNSSRAASVVPLVASNGVAENNQADFTGQGDDVTLVVQDQGYALPPRPTLNLAKKKIPYKRKRKLVVDEHKCISSDQFRQQLQDPSDLLKKLEFVPASEEIFFIREIGGLDKMWNYPGIYFDDGVAALSSKLTKFFMEQLGRAGGGPQTNSMDDFFPDTLNVSSDEYSRTMSHIMDPTAFGPDEMLLPVEDYVEPISPESRGNKRARDGGKSPISGEETGNDAHHTPRSKKPKGPENDDEEGELEEEAHPEDHDKMSRRTKEVFDQFSALLARRHTPRHSNPDGLQSVNFEDLVRGRHRERKEVAQRFYSSLVLKKLQAVDVEQEEPYGNIWLKKGARFEEFSV